MTLIDNITQFRSGDGNLSCELQVPPSRNEKLGGANPHNLSHQTLHPGDHYSLCTDEIDDDTQDLVHGLRSTLYEDLDVYAEEDDSFSVSSEESQI